MTAEDPELGRVPMDAVDLDLLAEIAKIYDVLDPMPAILPDVVLFALEATDFDAEMARLVESELALSGTRGEVEVEHARRVTFTSDHLTVMVAVEPHGSGSARLDGWAAPGAGLRVDVRAGDRTLTTQCDADGRFGFDAVPLGPVQLTLTPTVDSDPSVTVPVVTPAIQL